MDMWTIGFADRLRFPASRASSEGGEMLAFAHIPTKVDPICETAGAAR
jgi:hypothetical protein